MASENSPAGIESVDVPELDIDAMLSATQSMASDLGTRVGQKKPSKRKRKKKNKKSKNKNADVDIVESENRNVGVDNAGTGPVEVHVDATNLDVNEETSIPVNIVGKSVVGNATTGLVGTNEFHHAYLENETRDEIGEDHSPEDKTVINQNAVENDEKGGTEPLSVDFEQDLDNAKLETPTDSINSRIKLTEIEDTDGKPISEKSLSTTEKKPQNVQTNEKVNDDKVQQDGIQKKKTLELTSNVNEVELQNDQSTKSNKQNAESNKTKKLNGSIPIPITSDATPKPIITDENLDQSDQESTNADDESISVGASLASLKSLSFNTLESPDDNKSASISPMKMPSSKGFQNLNVLMAKENSSLNEKSSIDNSSIDATGSLVNSLSFNNTDISSEKELVSSKSDDIAKLVEKVAEPKKIENTHEDAEIKENNDDEVTERSDVESKPLVDKDDIIKSGIETSNTEKETINDDTLGTPLNIQEELKETTSLSSDHDTSISDIKDVDTNTENHIEDADNENEKENIPDLEPTSSNKEESQDTLEKKKSDTEELIEEQVQNDEINSQKSGQTLFEDEKSTDETSAAEKEPNPESDKQEEAVDVEQSNTVDDVDENKAVGDVDENDTVNEESELTTIEKTSESLEKKDTEQVVTDEPESAKTDATNENKTDSNDDSEKDSPPTTDAVKQEGAEITDAVKEEDAEVAQSDEFKETDIDEEPNVIKKDETLASQDAVEGLSFVDHDDTTAEMSNNDVASTTLADTSDSKTVTNDTLDSLFAETDAFLKELNFVDDSELNSILKELDNVKPKKNVAKVVDDGESKKSNVIKTSEIERLNKKEPVYIFTSLAGGGFHMIPRTNRLATILTANRIEFTYRDLGTDDLARKVWRTYGKGRSLPAVVRGRDDIIGNWEEIIEINEEYRLYSAIYESI